MQRETNLFSMDMKSQNYGYRTVGLLALSSIIMHILDTLTDQINTLEPDQRMNVPGLL